MPSVAFEALADPCRFGGHVTVRFVLECSETRVGERVRVVGSCPELGCWSPRQSTVELQTCPEEFPKWTSDWQRLVPSNVEYKYVICMDDGDNARWEEAVTNRTLKCDAEAGDRRITVVERFNGPRLVALNEATLSTLPPSSCCSEVDELGDLPEISPRVLEGSPMGFPAPPRSTSFHGFRVGPMHSFDDDDVFAKGLVRWNSFGCEADLPVGFLPSRRRGSRFGKSGMYREVSLEHGEAEQHAKGRTASVVSTCLDLDTSDVGHDVSGSCWDTSSDSDRSSAPMDHKSTTIFRNEQEFSDLYCVQHRLGGGAFGVVFSCFPRGGVETEYAVKVVQKNRLSDNALEQLVGDEENEGEIALHMSLSRHPNIVCLHECFEEASGIRLVMDLCRGGDVFDEVVRAKQQRCRERVHGALNSSAARNVLRQLLAALAFCHDNGVVHRDVKVENMLLEYPTSQAPLEGTGNTVKLCDFGLSARCHGEATLTQPVGSPDYLAPEIARLEPYGSKVDVWSAGAVLFVCLRGSMPYQARTDVEALQKVREGRYQFDSSWDFLDQDARRCVEQLMVLDAASRPCARGALSLPWIC